MSFSELLNPANTLGAFLISVLASLLAGAIIGFIGGRSYEIRVIAKSKQNGIGNINIQNSNRRV